MEESTSITGNIRQGKLNWAKMEKRILKESVDQMGGSDISPNADMQGGRFDTRKDKLDVLASNIKTLGDIPEFKKMQAELSGVMSKDKVDKVVANARRVKLAIEDGESLDKSIEEVLQLRNNEKNKIVTDLNKEINEFNSSVKQAIDWHQRPLATDHTALPPVQSLNDFKNMQVAFADYPHLAAYLIQDVDNVGKKQVNEASRQRLNIREPTEAGKQNAENETLSLYKWLSRTHVEGKQKIVQHLYNIFRKVAELEVFEAVNKGLEQKLQRVRASMKSQQKQEDIPLVIIDADSTENANLTPEELDAIVQRLRKEGIINDNKPAEPEIKEVFTPRTASGPGKVVDVNDMSQISESEKNDQEADKATHRKTVLTEGWNKIANRSIKTAKNVKPDDFTLLMG
jgi:hypothetical protein